MVDAAGANGVADLPGTPGLGGVAELAQVVRGGFVESRHFGMAVALAPDGQVRYAAGEVDATVLPRSTAKPLQAVGCLVAGADLEPDATAIAAGSHTGEDRHVALVDRMLASAGLDRSALRCPPDHPEDEPTRLRLIAEGVEPEPVRMNCSGKHAALLLVHVASSLREAGGPLLRTEDEAAHAAGGYLDPGSAVQRTVSTTIDRLTDATGNFLTVDGCGTPLPGVPLTGLARAFGRLTTAAPGTPEYRVAAAMRARPELVGGRGHVNSDTMRLLPGVLAKGGAEGVIAMAAPDGHAVAVKVIDGNPRATTALGLALLARCGVDVGPAAELTRLPVLGGGVPVGRIVTTLD